MASFSMNLNFHAQFVKMHGKLQPRLQEQCDERLALFVREPFHPILRNHALTGKYMGYRSINITDSLRAHYKEIGETAVIFVQVGTHSQLYGK